MGINGLRILAEQYGRLVLTQAIAKHERVALDLPNAEAKVSASLSKILGNSETLWIAIEGDTAALTEEGARDLAQMLLGLVDAVQAHRVARAA
ncbi:MAG: hypothetical protein WCA81_05715 [Rhizomicrobium sp.]